MKKFILGATLIGLLSFPVFTTHAITFNDIATGDYKVVYQYRNETHYADNNIVVINGSTRTPEIIMKLYTYTAMYRGNFVLRELVYHYYYNLDTRTIELAIEEVYLINGENGKILDKEIYKNPKKTVMNPGQQGYVLGLYALNLATQSGQLNLSQPT